MHKLDEHVPFPATLDLADFSCTAEPSRHIDEWRDAVNGAPAVAAVAAVAATAAVATAAVAAVATAAEEEEEAAVVAADAGASAPSMVLQTTSKLLRLYGVVEHHGSFEGAHPCRKQGPYGRPEPPKRLIGRGWPKLGAA